MSNTFKIDLNWKRSTDFTYDNFNRNHSLMFSGQQFLNNSAAVEYLGNADMANPEELLVSSLASCHMLTFLAVASKSGYIVDTYNDQPIALLEKNEEGRLAVTTIDLKPVIEFSGAKIPDEDQLKALHDKAHRNCFIANSIKSKVNIHALGRIS
ncbi:MAG: OsmC family protein [Bacteriovorax sp.]|nr:OsmC family protein [Bacteriovorax sp.]